MKKALRVSLVSIAAIFGCLVLFGFVIGASGNKELTDKVLGYQTASPDLLLQQTNAERAKAGLNPLVLDNRLNQSAQAKADDMYENNYFQHNNPITGKHGYDWINDTGLKCKPGSPAENQQKDGSTHPMDAYHIVSDPKPGGGFMSSKPHREAMLNPGIDIVGFGIRGNLVVEHFCDLVE